MFIVGSTLSYAQVRKIPSEVTEAFKEKYPEAAKVEWRDKLSTFSAVFELDNIQYEARFNSKGEWQFTQNEIEESDLPEVVKDSYSKSKYADWEMKSVYKIELADGTTQYRIETELNELRKKNLVFNSEGRMLKDRITI